MVKHDYDPEHGKDLPLKDTQGAAPAGGSTGETQ
jgi:hypothetical protein